ncbi:ThiF family adenylyltransferase [Numidum massiliense]|uniref:ThiF family adenylyltransferase n=1 Tax=Numidum massiliense TaxID=1522315 RepID=UPI0006D5A7BF|nr:ThiF family adenylyltransferase [Numidum massiliense]
MTERYSRLALFSPIGKKGVEQLRQSAVLIVGAGALGCPNAEMLTRAGVGLIRLVDRDYVDWSNLQRQPLFDEQDARDVQPKAVAAAKRLSAINSDVRIEPLVTDVTAENVFALLDGIDVVIDATDNFETRYLLNDAACERRLPWLYGACVGAYGASLTIVPGETPCLACVFGEDIPAQRETCDTTGVIAPAPQMVASYQAAEALKLLTHNKKQLRQTLVSFDLWKNENVEIKVGKKRRANCPVCGKSPVYPYLSEQKGTSAAVLCGRDTVQIRLRNVRGWDLATVAQAAKSIDPEAVANPHLVSFRADGCRLVVFRDGRVLVHGTKDAATARKLCAKYLGM